MYWVVETTDEDVDNTRKIQNVANLRRNFGTSKSKVFEQHSYKFDAVLRRPSRDEMTLYNCMDWWEQDHKQLKCTKSL